MEMPFALTALGAAILVVAPAAGQTIDCADARAADPALTYHATDGFRVCAPIVDEDLEPLEPGELATCSVEVAGVATLTQDASPGELLTFPPVSVPGSKRGNVSATCTGPGGTSSPTPTYSALLRIGKPGRPVLVEWR